ncbi:hypothetical protein DEAC_c14440 [Desulfosporosinus acididurans]|uniref:Uncharacterized protein n=1 Tax=Desulfosporosinus acididurans TaxID=476652 RepID=A0A0J1IQ08_9FIRM|nr:hypothetical protein [Desulfosporosinus acididurans]KLU66776.1 hypothetical protein DEAC_c14440 [Desulfosporosinus acididurans]
MPNLAIALYSSWDDVNAVADETRSLDDTTIWDDTLDGNQSIDYLLNAAHATAYYEGGGIYESQPVDLSPCGEVQSAKLTRTENGGTGTSLVIETALSPDGGTTWGAWQAVNVLDSNIPGISAGMDLTGYKLKYRARLNTTNLAATPTVSEIKITVTSRKMFRVFSSGTIKAKADIVPTASEQL